MSEEVVLKEPTWPAQESDEPKSDARQDLAQAIQEEIWLLGTIVDHMDKKKMNKVQRDMFNHMERMLDRILDRWSGTHTYKLDEEANELVAVKLSSSSEKA